MIAHSICESAACKVSKPGVEYKGMTKTEQAIPEGVQVRYFGYRGTVDEVPGSRPLVLVNGIGAGVGEWSTFPDKLNRPGFAIDVSGAVSCKERPGMADYSDALIDTIDAIESGPVDILGSSWGGALVQEAAIRRGDRFGSLVLAVTLYGPMSVPPKLAAMRGLMSADRSSPGFIRRAGSIYGGDIRRDPGLLMETGISRSVDEQSYARQKRAIQRWGNTLLRLRNIHNPTLVLAGMDDPIAQPINARLMALAIPTAELHLVSGDEGGGHLMLYTRPKESAEVVGGFLDRNV
jgi:pimeloyl-ACP methyl ester carboxylesterase